MAPRAAILALFIALLTSSTQAAVLAVDYGSDWIKASVPKPGQKGALDVLLNRDSKRKIQSVVAWNKEERSFGSDAANLAPRFPMDTFGSLKYLQGALHGGIASSFYSAISDAETVKTSRGTVAFKRPDGSEWSVEELVGMQLQYVKDLAEEFAGEPVTDVVMTVPPFYTQFQRQAVIDAIEIAGMKPLALMSDGLGVALHYAIPRSFPEKEHHIIYDAGASSITASVVSFFNTKIPDPTKVLKSSLKNTTAVHVKGVGWETNTSGTELDRRIRDILMHKFKEQHGKSVRNIPRAMARLWKEAGRVKGILSANAECSVNLESLVDELDFKTSITRAEFVKMTEDLVPSYTQPIADAIAAANLTMSDIKSVIMTGGASRIPMIRDAVQELVGQDKFSAGVNADEAAVLGAAFHAATLSGRFQSAKKFDLREVAPHDIVLSYAADKKSGASRVINSVVYSAGSRMGGSPKSVKFPHKNDFKVAVKYKNGGTHDFPQDLFETTITGVEAAFANLTRDGVETPSIRMDALLTDSGMMFLSNAVARGEAPAPKEKEKESILDKVKNLVTGDKDKDKEEAKSASSSSSSSSSSENTKPTESSASASSTSSTAAEKPKETVQMRTLTVPLTMETKLLSVPQLSAEDMANSRKRLAAIKEAEIARAKHSEAVNHLEGYLYRLRDLLEGDEDTPFMEFSKPEEREMLTKKTAETSEWFHEHAETAEATEIWKKRDEIEMVESTIINRYKEAETGPKALADLQKALYLGRQFIISARQNYTAETEAGDPHRHTEEELNKVEKALDEHEGWLKDKSAEQKKLSKREDAVLKTIDMDTRGIQIQKLVATLRKKRAPPKKVTTTASPSATGEPTASAETTTTSATATSQPGAEQTPQTEEPPSQKPRDEL